MHHIGLTTARLEEMVDYKGAGVGMGWSKEGPGSEVHGGCVPSSQPTSSGPSDVEARVSYRLAAFATHKKRGREGTYFSGSFRDEGVPAPPLRKPQSRSRRQLSPPTKEGPADGRMPTPR